MQEFFADVLAINPHLFTLNMTGVLSDNSWRRPMLERSTSALVSVLLSLKKRPLVRYQASSAPCQVLAQEISRVMQVRWPAAFLLCVCVVCVCGTPKLNPRRAQTEGQLFDFRQTYDVPPTLLVRRGTGFARPARDCPPGSHVHGGAAFLWAGVDPRPPRRPRHALAQPVDVPGHGPRAADHHQQPR